MKNTRKITAVLLACLLLFSACSGGDVSWAFKSGGTYISSGLYILYQMTAFGEAEEKIYAETQDSYTGMEASELLKQTVEGKPASDWIKERAKELAKEHIAVENKFNSTGLSLTDAELASVESTVGSLASSAGAFYEKNGISETTLREFYTGYARKNRLFLSLYGEGGSSAVAEEELIKYFTDNYASIDVFVVFKTTMAVQDDGKTLDEIVNEERTQAQEYLARLKAGEEIEELYYEQQQKQVGEAQKDSITKPEKGELRMMISEDVRSSYGDALTDAALKAKVGDSEMVEDNDFFVVFQKVDSMDDPNGFEAYKSSLLKGLKDDEYESMLSDLAAAVQMEVNDAAVARYKPENIRFEGMS